jgi:hypothetical protein
MFPTLSHIANSVAQGFGVLLDWFEKANVYFHDHFGLTGQLTFNLTLFGLLFLILMKISKAAFKAVAYVIIPSLILSFLTSFALPYSFLTVLPFCAGFLIVVNIIKSQ